MGKLLRGIRAYLYDARTCGVLEKSSCIHNNYKKDYEPVDFYVFLPFNLAMSMGGGKLQIYDASYVCCPRMRKLTKKVNFHLFQVWPFSGV